MAAIGTRRIRRTERNFILIMYCADKNGIEKANLGDLGEITMYRDGHSKGTVIVCIQN
jgi:hypothetical protein